MQGWPDFSTLGGGVLGGGKMADFRKNPRGGGILRQDGG